MTSRRSFMSGLAGLFASAALPGSPEGAAARRFVIKPATYAEGDLLIAMVWRRDGVPISEAPTGWSYLPAREDDGQAISVSMRPIG